MSRILSLIVAGSSTNASFGAVSGLILEVTQNGNEPCGLVATQPAGRAGAVTGGVLSFGQIGAFLGPSAFSLLLHLTGGYGAGWAVCAIPAFWVGISLSRLDASRPRRSPVSQIGGG